MKQHSAALLAVLTFATCTWVHSQEAPPLQVESRDLLDKLSRIQQCDEAELQAMATALKEVPAGKVDPALRIRATGNIAERLLELKATDAAVAQFREAIALPIASGEEAQGCTNMWAVAIDTLAFHLNHADKSDQIIPTLDQYARHSDSTCFKATFAALRGKWLLYTGDKEASMDYLRDAVEELFPIGPETAVYELEPLHDLVVGLSDRDRALQIASLEQIAKLAESAIRGGESLEPFCVVMDCRTTLCRNAVTDSEGDVDIARYSEGVEELSRIAIKHASGFNAKSDKDRIELFLAEFEPRLEKMKLAFMPAELVGKMVPQLAGVWITPAEVASFEELRGKVVIVDFWAIWCGPCVASFPEMQGLQDRFREDGLVVVGVTNWYGYGWDATNNKLVGPGPKIEQSALDSGDHAAEVSALRGFLTERKVKYAQLAVNNAAAAPFAVESLPTIVVVDKKGVVRKVLTGGSEATHAALSRTVKSLLDE